MRRTPHRRWLNERWDAPHIQAVYRKRPEVDRMYSVLKSGRFALFALPPWVRHLHAVQRWVGLKQLQYHAYLLVMRRQ